MWIGIDPGLDGAAVSVDSSGKIIEKHIMPVIGGEKRFLDLPALNLIFRGFAECLVGIEACYLESVSSMPGQGVASTFKFGRVFGAIEALLVANEIPYTLVPARVWTKEMHAGIPGEEPKAKSRVALARLFPGVDLRASERCKAPHDGLLDALLIANYGLRRRKT